MSSDKNVERLVSAKLANHDKLSDEKRRRINDLSDDEVDKLIQIAGKITVPDEDDDEFGSFPV